MSAILHVIQIDIRTVVVVLMCLSYFCFQTVMWHKQSGGEGEGIDSSCRLGSLCPSIYPSLLPCLHHLPDCIRPTSWASWHNMRPLPSCPFTHKGAREMNSLPQWEPIHQLQSTLKAAMDCTHPSRLSFKGTGLTWYSWLFFGCYIYIRNM